MPTNVEQIETIKTQTLAIIASLTESPNPSYTIGGQSVSWADYLKQLQGTIDWCDQQLNSQEPFEIQTEAFT